MQFRVSLRSSPPPVSAPMHVGERPTWLNSEALSHDKDIFFEKKKIGLFGPTNSLLCALDSTGECLKSWEKPFLRKS